MSRIKLFSAFIFSFGLFFPGIILAETTSTGSVAAESVCECFCGKQGVGTIGPVNTKFGECESYCKKTGAQPVICATAIEQYPANNLRCFTKEQCENSKGDFGTVQPFECPSGKGYCYSPPTPYELAVSIGGQKTVFHIGEYIDLIYRWLLGAGLTIAIVMVMIGGLQYSIGSAVGSKAAAKKRIVNAVTGVVLLLMTWMILYTVNPNLTKLSLPTLPKIRKVVLLSGEPSCEELLDPKLEGGKWKLEIPSGTKKACGGQAKVIEDPDGNAAMGGSICNFTKCDEAEARCYGQGNTAGCYKCQDVMASNYEQNPLDGKQSLKPSSEVCAQLSIGTTGEGNNKIIDHCFWTTEADIALNPEFSDAVGLFFGVPGLVLSGTAAKGLDLMQIGTCAELKFDCNEINSCADYDTLIAKNKDENACMMSIDPFDGIDGYVFGGDYDLEKLCNENPCGVGSSTTENGPKSCGIINDDSFTGAGPSNLCVSKEDAQKVATKQKSFDELTSIQDNAKCFIQ